MSAIAVPILFVVVRGFPKTSTEEMMTAAV